jgi:hypothetical protein
MVSILLLKFINLNQLINLFIYIFSFDDFNNDIYLFVFFLHPRYKGNN